MRSDIFIYTTPKDPRAQPLLDELGREYESRYGDFYLQESSVPEIQRYPAELFTPAQGGNFLLLLRDGQTIAGGAFKQLDAQTAELKRVWTDSRLRRQGLARTVLVELEAQAQRQGYQRVFLTTGFRQPEAVGLYLGHGYQRLFDPSADLQQLRKLPFEKRLQATPQQPQLHAPHTQLEHTAILARA